MTVLDYTDDIKAALTEAGMPVWSQIADAIGTEIVDAYLATGGQSRE